MFGIGFIIIGIIVLLQTAGFLTGISGGVVWGVAFILIGIMMIARRSMRRERRRKWMIKNRVHREGVVQEASDKIPE